MIEPFTIAVEGGICRATIGNPPINPLDVPLLAGIECLTREAWGYVNRALPADELRWSVDKPLTTG